MPGELWCDFEFRTTFPLRRPGATYGSTNGSAHVRLTRDLSGLHPYLHAVADYVRCFTQPPRALFLFDGKTCTLHRQELTAAAFPNAGDARMFLARLGAALERLEARRAELEPRYVPERTGAALEILRALPRTSCGECGLGSCTAFAVALSQGEVFPQRCPEMPAPVVQTATYPVFDRDGVLTSTVSLPVEQGAPAAPAATPSGASASDEPRRNRISLTDRELEVMRLLVEGASNPEIAAELAISAHTVKTHVTHIFDKLGVSDRTEAAVRALRLGLVE